VTARSIRVLFAVSLMFNAAVVAGVLYGAYSSKSSLSKVREAGPFKQLGLTNEQQRTIDRSNLEALKRIISARDSMRMEWARGIELLGRPTLDWAAIRGQEAQIARAHERYQSLFFEAWMDRARLLSDAQRQKLFAILSNEIKSGKFFEWKAPEGDSKGAKQ